MAEITLTGISPLQKRIRDIEKSMQAKISAALEERARSIVERAKELVPERSGELKDSIRFVKAQVEQGRTETGQYTEGTDLVVRVTAGGEGIDHAVAIHEYPSEYNPPSWDGVAVQFGKGGAKFLERPLLEEEQGLAGRIAGEVKLK